MASEQKKIQHPHPENDFDNLKATVQKYGGHALTVGLVILVAVTAFRMFRSHTMQRSEEADRRFAQAQSVEDFEAFIRDFEKAEITPLAVISLAKLHFDNGDFAAALSQYERFLAQWPKHDMATTATLGSILCLETRGDSTSLQEAADSFATFTADHPEHYLIPQSVLGQARCFEQLGRLQEAQTLYENFIASHPNSFWSVRAEELLAAVQRRIKHAAPLTT